MPISEHSFFPLWLGFVLTINGASKYLFKKSLLGKMKRRFILLFLISIPFWWMFEIINLHLQNWYYLFPRPVGQIEYLVRASISFSTVIPAVLSTAFLFEEILKKTKWLKKRKVYFSLYLPHVSIIFGILLLTLTIALPRIAFPFTWISLFFVFDPINYLEGKPSILKEVKDGNWTIPVSIAASTLFTGFFWEFWNFYSMPKWQYSLPFVNFLRIFEMPTLGFLGYPFFGLELYSFVNLCSLYKKTTKPEG